MRVLSLSGEILLRAQRPQARGRIARAKAARSIALKIAAAEIECV
jgi:hypothetical protein